ncbi:hypothetical protein BGZ57DRAFT_858264 [Hyaloscypha finlandica]|nr:hypothetical protein BGZ57DRAFT_858264 [Hyaloscypha finlandica]
MARIYLYFCAIFLSFLVSSLPLPEPHLPASSQLAARSGATVVFTPAELPTDKGLSSGSNTVFKIKSGTTSVLAKRNSAITILSSSEDKAEDTRIQKSGGSGHAGVGNGIAIKKRGQAKQCY